MGGIVGHKLKVILIALSFTLVTVLLSGGAKELGVELNDMSLFGATSMFLALALVLFLDDSDRGWVSYLTVGICVLTGVVLFGARGDSLFFLFCSLQAGVSAIGMARTRATIRFRAISAALIGLVVGAVLTRAFAWTSVQEYRMIFYFVTLMLALVPLLLDTIDQAQDETLWFSVVFQQAVLRVGTVFFFQSQPANTDYNNRVFTLPPLLLACGLVLGAMFFKGGGYWERARQSFLSLTVIAISVMTGPEVTPFLFALIAVSFALSSEVGNEGREGSQLLGIGRVLDGGGLGGIVSLLLLVLFHKARKEIPYPESLIWVVLIFVIGGLSWLRSLDLEGTSRGSVKMDRRAAMKIAIHVVACLGLLVGLGLFGGIAHA